MKYNFDMNSLRRNFCKLLFVAFLVFMPVVSLAQNVQGDVEDNCEVGKICNPINADSINGVIQEFLEGALKIGIPLVVLAIIYCGFLFVAAQGKAEKLTDAKNALFYTIIGAGILLGAWAIAQVISETVNSL